MADDAVGSLWRSGTAGILAGATSSVLLALAGALVLQLTTALARDPSGVGDSLGWLLVFSWPLLLALLLVAGTIVGIITAALVHKKISGRQRGARRAVSASFA